jgi:hypothetical protein
VGRRRQVWEFNSSSKLDVHRSPHSIRVYERTCGWVSCEWVRNLLAYILRWWWVWSVGRLMNSFLGAGCVHVRLCLNMWMILIWAHAFSNIPKWPIPVHITYLLIHPQWFNSVSCSFGKVVCAFILWCLGGRCPCCFDNIIGNHQTRRCNVFIKQEERRMWLTWLLVNVTGNRYP